MLRLFYLAQNELKVMLCFLFSVFCCCVLIFFTFKRNYFKVLAETLPMCMCSVMMLLNALHLGSHPVSLVLKMIQIDNITMGFLLCLEI